MDSKKEVIVRIHYKCAQEGIITMYLSPFDYIDIIYAHLRMRFGQKMLLGTCDFIFTFEAGENKIHSLKGVDLYCCPRFSTLKYNHPRFIHPLDIAIAF
jgi:hypothetical protein